MQVAVDYAAQFCTKLDEAAGLPLRKRLEMWPEALTCLQTLVVLHAQKIRERAELHGKVARFQKLRGLLNGTMTDPERDTMYLATFELGEAILAPFGFDAKVAELRNQISVQEVSRRTGSQQEFEEFRLICSKLTKMLPWPVKITVDAGTLGDDTAETTWDGHTNTLTYSVEHMRIVCKNLKEQGVYITLVGQVLAAMMTGPKPIAPIVSVLIVTAQLGIALGAKDTFLDRGGKREPPDVYRGSASKVLRALWNESRTVEELRTVAPGADVERIVQMLNTDATTFGWRVCANGPFLSVIAA